MSIKDIISSCMGLAFERVQSVSGNIDNPKQGDFCVISWKI